MYRQESVNRNQIDLYFHRPLIGCILLENVKASPVTSSSNFHSELTICGGYFCSIRMIGKMENGPIHR